MRVVDLFAGCGGMSLGFEQAGYNIEAAFENWKPAIQVYKENFNHPLIEKDLSDETCVEDIAKFSPDVIIGGPPCQDFSSAGYRDESLGRADLTISYANIIASVKPKFFVMENVDRITKSKVYKVAKEIFKKAGYGVSEMTIDACYFNVPQKRKRFFLIGTLNDKDGFMDGYIDKFKTETPMSIYDYFGDSLGVEYYFRIPRSYNRRAVFSIYEPSVTIRGVERPIPSNYKKHPGDLVEIGDLVRSFTIKERSQIQTFPNDFKINGVKTHLNQMIGNAVPVNLAKSVASALKMYIGDNS